MEPDVAKIGKRIEQARIDLSMSQHQLYEKTNISTSQLSAYENGKRATSLYNLAKIAKALNKTIDELYFGSLSERPISTSDSIGQLIVNCVVALYENDVIYIANRNDNYRTKELFISKYNDILVELVDHLDNIERNKNDYKDPDLVKEQTIDAYANKINTRIEKRHR